MFDIMAQYQRLRVLQNIKIMVTGFLLFDRMRIGGFIQAPSGSRIIAYRHPKHMQQYGDMAIDLQLSTAMDVWLNHRIINAIYAEPFYNMSLYKLTCCDAFFCPKFLAYREMPPRVTKVPSSRAHDNNSHVGLANSW